jgi:two-component system, LytTR family, response regulator
MNFPIFEKTKKAKMLKTIIIDDEEHVRKTLGKFLVKYCPQVVVAGEAAGVAEAYELINRHHPDLLLLDIELEDGTGFDLLKKFEKPDFKVIFITAHNEFAIQAFKVSALDYILKPVNPEELAGAVEKASQLVQQELRLKLEALETNLNAEDKKCKKVVIKSLESIHLLDKNNITHCESDGSYCTVYTSEGVPIVTSKPIKDFDEMLTGSGFYRVHRSYLINLSHIKRLDKAEGGTLILSNDKKIPVASRKRDVLLGLLDELAE